MKTQSFICLSRWLTLHQLNIKKLILLFFLYATFYTGYGQSCTVNSGLSVTTCGTTATLTGNVNGTLTGNAQWTFISGPVTPTIVSPNSLTTGITGMTIPGDYIFQLSQTCLLGGTANQQVRITANPDPGVAIISTSFNECNNYAAIHTLRATPLLPGWTGVWTAHEMLYGNEVSNQFNFSAATSPVTTVQLVPAQQTCGNRGYYFKWTVTSPNGLCSYAKTVTGSYYPDINQVSFNTSGVTTCGPGAAGFTATSCGFWAAYLNTSFTILPISVPAGFAGTLTGNTGSNGNLLVNGFTVAGTYTFNVTINFPACGTAKTFGPFTVNVGKGLPTATFTSTPANFCLNSAPSSVTFNFKVSDPTDISELESAGPVPVTYTITGAGNTDRSITFTPVSGWNAGPFKFSLGLKHASDPAGICKSRASSWIFIYDGNPPLSTSIANITACVPVNKTSVSGTINLPDLNINYLGGDFAWLHAWTFQKISGPASGSVSNAAINSPTASFSGLTEGIYTFRATFIGNGMQEELSCSGGFTPPIFTITVFNQQGANAGSNQTINCIQLHPLVANVPNPPSIGTWSMESGPSPMQFSDIHNPDASVSIWTNSASSGTYVFKWTITDPGGNCPAVSSTVSIIATAPCNYLPAKLIRFSAAPSNGTTLLNWTTATEVNTRLFFVEWSTDAINWKDNGSVVARGGSDKTDYNYIHQRPGPGINYYRLRLVDMDGRFTYSNVVSTRFDRSAAIEIIPNPAKDNLFIYNLSKGDQIRLISMSGKTERSLTAVEHNITLQISSLPPGLYILQVNSTGNEQARQFKIIKQ